MPAAKGAKRLRRARRDARVVADAAAVAAVDGDAVGATAATKADAAMVLRPSGLSNLRESQRSAAPVPLTPTCSLPIGSSGVISLPAANHHRRAGPATASPGLTEEAEASAGHCRPQREPAALRNRGFPSSVLAERTTERAAEKERANRASVHQRELRGSSAGGAGDAAAAAENQPREIVSAKNGCRPNAIPTTMASTAQGPATGR